MKVYDRLFIGGEWVAPAGTGTIEVVNPATEEPAGRVPEATEADIDRAVEAARKAFDEGPWPKMAPTERAEILTKVSQAVQAEMADLAALISTEMGSPVSWATMGQVFAPSMIFDYYAGLAGTYPFDDVRQGLMGQVLVTSEPVGVVGAIAPWNVPLFIAAAKLSPALVAGCTMVFKPAPETPLDAFRLAELFAETGLPEGVLSVVPAGRETGEHLVRH
ncbi:MAG TPA: aldehyde dehydrogenase family protein, partial [Acidimicrobiales bacterium]|nr:aldehyde dehydrogenase family protein [Acidimicrobiales bacterium]